MPTKKDKLKEIIRLSIQTTVRTIDPLFWLSFLKSKFIIGINEQIFKNFPFRLLKKDKYIVQPAIGVETIDKINIERKNSNFEILFVGHFYAIKCPLLVIDAFSSFLKNSGSSNAHLTMIGEGALKNKMLKLIEEKNLQKRIKILPWMERKNVIDHMKRSNVFLFPSFEGGGMVVLEAMATGLPVICFNYGGPGSMINDKTGIKVKAGNYNEATNDIASAINKLYEEPDFRNKLSENSANRVRTEFLWSNKLSTISNLYEQILSEKSSA